MGLGKEDPPRNEDKEKKEMKKKKKIESDGNVVDEESSYPDNTHKKDRKKKRKSSQETFSLEEESGYRDVKKNETMPEECGSGEENSIPVGPSIKNKKRKKTHSEGESDHRVEPYEDRDEMPRKIKSKKHGVADENHSDREHDISDDNKKRTITMADKHVSEVEKGSSGETCCEEGGEKKRKKLKSANHIPVEKDVLECSDKDRKKKRKKTKLAENGSGESMQNIETPDVSGSRANKGPSKRVSFSNDVQIFPSSSPSSSMNNDENEGSENGRNNNVDGDLVRGKRFSKEEDEMLRKAVFDYIEGHGLGDEGLDMVLHCKKHPEVKDCWKQIRSAIPYRPLQSIYSRAHILFERDEKRGWTSEEYEIIRNFHEKHGSKWKALADALGKHRWHVKDTWRRIKSPNRKKGPWLQEEYQQLFDLVNIDLRTKAFEEKKSKYGMLRDNISWEAISDKLSTRPNCTCCLKWYSQLTSPMVAEGIWADADDYRLLDALFNLDACSMEDVEWDDLVENRSGEVCRKRWTQMVKHIGEHGNKSFAEQVEVLSKRYRIDVLEAREAYDSKPRVP